MSAELKFPLVDVAGIEQWRNWLAAHHASEQGAWLVYYKPHSGKPTLKYGDSVEEALCFGWVDNLVRKLDENRYARRFVPRKPDSNWSASNRQRIRRLTEAGRMQDAGLALVAAAKRSGHWKDHQRPAVSEDMPDELATGLAEDPGARAFFESITPKQQLQFIVWINAAARPDTRARRVAESLRLLGTSHKLGMK